MAGMVSVSPSLVRDMMKSSGAPRGELDTAAHPLPMETTMGRPTLRISL